MSKNGRSYTSEYGCDDVNGDTVYVGVTKMPSSHYIRKF